MDAEKICRNCEYWDGGGEKAAKTARLGDCLNRRSPRFTTEPTFTCNQFYDGKPSLVGLTIPHGYLGC